MKKLVHNSFFSTTSYILTTLLLFISCSYEDNKNEIKKNDWEDMGLIGKVKSITTYGYKAVERFGEVEKISRTLNDNIEDHKVLFNDMGNITEKYKFNLDETKSNKWIYNYNKNQKKVEANWINISTNDTMSNILYEYDDKGNLITELDAILIVFESFTKFSYKYDSNNHLVEKDIFNAYYDYLDSKWKYKNDKYGNMIEASVYDYLYNKEGKLLGIYKYKYDNKKNLIEEEDLTSNGELYRKNVYKYDDKGNRIEYNSYESDGSLSFKHVYKYDDKGNLIDKRRYESDSKLDGINSYKYTYDKKGNWIKKISYYNEKPTYIQERKIEYF